MNPAELQRTSRLLRETGKELYGLDLTGYHQLYIERRLNYFAVRYGLNNGSSLVDLLVNQPGIIQELQKELNIGYTTLFRDPTFFLKFTELIRRQIEQNGHARIWHAGCSKGHEVFSLLMLLEEKGLADQCKIYATDINVKHLNHAERGVITTIELQDSVRRYLASGGNQHPGNYFKTTGNNAILQHNFLRKIRFGIHDLGKDLPFHQFDFILCRNVFIYYQPYYQKKLLKCITKSLQPGGYIGLSPSENIEEMTREFDLDCFDRHLNIYKSVVTCKNETEIRNK